MSTHSTNTSFVCNVKVCAFILCSITYLYAIFAIYIWIRKTKITEDLISEISPRISSSTCDEQNSWRGWPFPFRSSEKTKV